VALVVVVGGPAERAQRFEKRTEQLKNKGVRSEEEARKTLRPSLLAAVPAGDGWKLLLPLESLIELVIREALEDHSGVGPPPNTFQSRVVIDACDKRFLAKGCAVVLGFDPGDPGGDSELKVAGGYRKCVWVDREHGACRWHEIGRHSAAGERGNQQKYHEWCGVHTTV